MFKKDMFLASSIIIVSVCVFVIKDLELTEHEIAFVGNIIVALIGLYGTLRKGTSSRTGRPTKHPRVHWMSRVLDTLLDIVLGTSLVLLLILIGFVAGLLVMLGDPDLASHLFEGIFL